MAIYDPIPGNIYYPYYPYSVPLPHWRVPYHYPPYTPYWTYTYTYGTATVMPTSSFKKQDVVDYEQMLKGAGIL